MSPEKQRIAIAIACGLQNVAPVIVRNVTHQGDDRTVGISSDSGWVPDYLNDLNACHEMEKVLTVAQRVTYAFQIGVVLSGGSVGRAIPDWWFIHIATPAQRAEAFLRTLGIWEKEDNTTKSASSTSPATEDSSVTLSESFRDGTTYTRSYQVFLPTPKPIQTKPIFKTHQ
jgi:hypothetical protein